MIDFSTHYLGLKLNGPCVKSVIVVIGGRDLRNIVNAQRAGRIPGLEAIVIVAVGGKNPRREGV